jgi:hypothetical protein
MAKKQSGGKRPQATREATAGATALGITLEEARLAVLAAHAAISGGDSEAIADARVGLEGAELTHLDLYERLEEAEQPLSAAQAEQLVSPWAELETTIAKKRTLKLPFDAAALPALQPRAPLKIVFDGALVLQGLKRELAKKEQLGLVELLTQAATRESRDRFALALGQSWRKAGQKAGEAWAWQQLGKLGGDRCAEYVGGLLDELTHARAVDGLEILGSIGTAQARYDIYRLGALPGRYAPRREHAQERFRAFAGRADSVTRVAARVVPAWPSDAVRPRVEETVSRWLLGALRDGDRIDAETFDLYVRRHPLVATLARGVIWGRYASNSRTAELQLSFRVDDQLTLRDVEGAELPIPDQGWFGVAHPLELEQLQAQLTQRWQGLLVAAKVEPTLEQLGRPLPELEPAQLEAPELTHFAGRRVGFHRIRDVLRSRGWFDGEENDGGGTDDFGLELLRSNGYAQANLGYGEITEVIAGKGKGYYSHRLRQPISWMHPIDRAEVLADIEAAVRPARSRAAAPASRAAERGPATTPAQPATSPAAEGDVLPQRGRFPFAELAKSSRSKCVVCGEKIEKGTVRIGVERLIETPNFTGRGAAYLHPGCREGCPELLATDDVDARLSQTSPEVWPPPD